MRKLRMRLWRWIKFSVFKIPEATRMPWYGIVVKSILYPVEALQFFLHSNREIAYDPCFDAILLFGVKFPLGLFWNLSHSRNGDYYRVVELSEGWGNSIRSVSPFPLGTAKILLDSSIFVSGAASYTSSYLLDILLRDVSSEAIISYVLRKSDGPKEQQ